MTPVLYRLISVVSVFAGITSLLFFLWFVLLGPLKIIQFDVTTFQALLLNSFLSMVFFGQHSFMVREPIRAKLVKVIPAASFYAIYSISSGVLLLLTTILWQQSPVVFITIKSPYRLLLFFLQFSALLGLVWSAQSLQDFDPFGRKQISEHLNQKGEKQETHFVVKGPYMLVRHPFYFFTLVLIWCHPVMSADRLLFNGLWSAWIVAGTLLEEKDLVKQIGDGYHQYQKKVPMLIPYKNWRQLIK